jgi:hypothetical protein
LTKGSTCPATRLNFGTIGPISPIPVTLSLQPTPAPLSFRRSFVPDDGADLRPIDGDGGGDFPDPPTKPTKQPTKAPTTSPVSKPLFAVQFNICLPADTLTAVQNSLLSGITQGTGGNPWLTSTCSAAGSLIGVWLTQPSGFSDSATARAAGVANAAFLSGGETFGVQLSAAAFHKFTDDAWKLIPKSFDTNGNPNANGPIFLQSYSLNLQQLSTSSGKIQLSISGKYDAPVDIPFDVEVTDLLTKVAGKISCANSNSVDVDTSIIDDLIVVSVFTAPFLIPALVDARNQADSYKQLPVGVIPENQKCIAKKAIPDDVPTTGASGVLFKGKKVDFSYSRLVVNNIQGVIAAGTWALVPRVPTVTIVGPAQIKGDTDADSVSAFYTVSTHDLVRPFQSVLWTASGALSKTAGTSAAGWPTLSVNWPATSVVKSVSVQISVVDNLQASASKTTSIVLTPGGLPPVCSKKPYLPQCE